MSEFQAECFLNQSANLLSRGNKESQNYVTDGRNSFFTPDNKLVIRAIAEPSHEGSSTKYTSARLISHQKFDRKRGCVSATLTAPCAVGIWPAFWLLPAKPFSWPVDGEMVIFETWNGDCVNHSCLHWGQYNHEDREKHRVTLTPTPEMGQKDHCFELAWNQTDSGGAGRLVWYIDGKAVMKAVIPRGIRKIENWRVTLNVAMGGNVCGGRLPEHGSYDLVVSELKMSSEPTGGWGQFDKDFKETKEGKTY